MVLKYKGLIVMTKDFREITVKTKTKKIENKSLDLFLSDAYKNTQNKELDSIVGIAFPKKWWEMYIIVCAIQYELTHS